MVSFNWLILEDWVWAVHTFDTSCQYHLFCTNTIIHTNVHTLLYSAMRSWQLRLVIHEQHHQEFMRILGNFFVDYVTAAIVNSDIFKHLIYFLKNDTTGKLCSCFLHIGLSSLPLLVFFCWLWCFLYFPAHELCFVASPRGQGTSMAQQDPYWINLQSLLEFVSSLSTAENQLSQDCFCQCCRGKGVLLLFNLLCLVRES